MYYKFVYVFEGCECTKGGFFSESMMRLLNLQNQKNKYSEKLSWAWNFEMLLCSKKQKSGKIQTTDTAKLKIVKRKILSWRIWRSKSSQYFSDDLWPLTKF